MAKAINKVNCAGGQVIFSVCIYSKKPSCGNANRLWYDFHYNCPWSSISRQCSACRVPYDLRTLQILISLPYVNTKSIFQYFSIGHTITCTIFCQDRHECLVINMNCWRRQRAPILIKFGPFYCAVCYACPFTMQTTVSSSYLIKPFQEIPVIRKTIHLLIAILSGRRVDSCPSLKITSIFGKNYQCTLSGIYVLHCPIPPADSPRHISKH